MKKNKRGQEKAEGDYLSSRLTYSAWAAFWYSKNKFDGINIHIIYCDNRLPALFRTRKECRKYINARYGYIRGRLDLQQEPHGWRLPRAVRVSITPNAHACDREAQIGMLGNGKKTTTFATNGASEKTSIKRGTAEITCNDLSENRWDMRSAG